VGQELLKVIALPREKWQYLILDTHPGYITWGRLRLLAGER